MAVGALSLDGSDSTPTLLETSPFTSFEGRERFPALSPDGSRVAFSWTGDTGDNLDIYLKQENTADPLRLTDHPTHEFFPTWSPDGTTVAYVRLVTDSTHFLYTVPALGGTPRRLIETHSAFYGLDWSPDGRHVVYASYQSGTYGLHKVAVADGTVSWVPVHEKRIYHPSVADQTGTLVYEEYTYEKDVWELNLAADSTAPDGDPPSRPLLTSTRWDSKPHYGPKGDRLVFTSARSGTPELWMSDADGTNPTKLTDFGGGSVGNPCWHPSGERIAFTAYPEGKASIYVMRVPGGTPKRVRATNGNGGTFKDRVTSWSRDGRWIYFASNRSQSWQLWKMHPDGSGLTQVTQNRVFAARESVSGDSLFYGKYETWGLWMRPTDGGAERRILDSLSEDDWSNWVVTAEGLYFIRRTEADPQIVFRPFGADNERVLATIPNIANPSLEVSPDGERLLYARIEHTNSDLIAAERPKWVRNPSRRAVPTGPVRACGSPSRECD